MIHQSRKHPCKCFVCKGLITTKELADKVQKNKVECFNCIGMRLIRWGFRQVRIGNGN